MRFTIFVYFMCLLTKTYSLMLKRECQHDEMHRSCSFYEEYTCWETAKLSRRVKSSPKRLAHCRAGCYCKKGLVRTYPHGRCIIAQACRDLQLRRVLEKIPAEFSDV